jgi:hypothetical protein
MPRFRFSLAAVQRYREHLRDVVRQELAQLLARDATLIEQRDEFLRHRADNIREMQILDEFLRHRADNIREMQILQQQARLDVDQTAARRYHSAQLTSEASRVEWQRQQLSTVIANCRERLIRADQSVKVLDQLEEKQRAGFTQVMEAQEARDCEEAWQAGQLRRASGAQ